MNIRPTWRLGMTLDDANVVARVLSLLPAQLCTPARVHRILCNLAVPYVDDFTPAGATPGALEIRPGLYRFDGLRRSWIEVDLALSGSVRA